VSEGSNKFAIHIASTLYNVGSTIVFVSIVANIHDLIALSHNLTEPRWLSSFTRLARYALWAGVLLVFAGILVRDRIWSRRRPGSNYPP
jgi:hypothetical protein